MNIMESFTKIVGQSLEQSIESDRGIGESHVDSWIQGVIHVMRLGQRPAALCCRERAATLGHGRRAGDGA